jgi:1-acyl-sn-glycerol-3-phosphate acyltransferase
MSEGEKGKGAARRIEAQAKALIPGAAADLEARDPEFIRFQLPAMWLLATLYFRAEVRGLERIPEEGPVLLVGNHSGGNMTPDSMVFLLAFNAYFGVERPLYILAHSLVTSWPVVGPFLRRWGVITAGPEAARAALEEGASVLVYPGGDVETHRPWSARHEIRFDGRKGFLRLARDAGVPIVPVVADGGQETFLPLTDGRRLARALGLDRLGRLKVLPVSLALPWGLNVGDLMGHIPLPVKIRVDALEPIDLAGRFGDRGDSEEEYRYVTGRMQEALTALAAEHVAPPLA